MEGLRVRAEVVLMRTGTTLMELVVCLAVLVAVTALATPRLNELGDRVEVRSVREELVGLMTQARAVGVARGGATLVLESEPPAALLLARDSLVRSVRLGRTALPPELLLPAGRASTAFDFDALGIGRFASATIVVRRGRAEAGIVVSSYGRVRRR
jgi:hypothetical protein